MGSLIAAVVQGVVGAILAPIQAWIAQRAAKRAGKVELREGDENAELGELETVAAPTTAAESDSLWERNKAKFGSAPPRE